MSLERRLEKLERHRRETGSPLDSPERLREEAERSIERSTQKGSEPVFQVAKDGQVYTRDGRPVTDNHQILAEEFYQLELEWGSELVFDADAEAFYTPEGELALSRTYVNLPRLWGEGVTPIE